MVKTKIIKEYGQYGHDMISNFQEVYTQKGIQELITISSINKNYKIDTVPKMCVYIYI